MNSNPVPQTVPPPTAKSQSRNLWILIGGLALAAVLCLFVITLVVIFGVVKPFSSKPTPTPTITPRPTRAPTPTNTPTPMQIALLLPLSGPVSALGESSQEGALIAFEEWNAKGGVLGLKIVPVIEDSQCNPDPAFIAADKVINQDNVHYIIGELCSRASIPISEIANAKGVVQISPSSINKSVTTNPDGTTKPYTFIISHLDEDQGKAIAKFSIEYLKANTAFMIYNQTNDYSQAMVESFEQYFTMAGGQIVDKETFPYGDTDFSTILDKVAETKPDLVVLPENYTIVNLVTAQAKAKGLTITFIGGDAWDSPDLDTQAASGGYFSTNFSPYEERPIVINFIRSYGERHKNADGTPKLPDMMAVLAYDATNLMLTAIEKAGVDDPAIVKDVLASIRFEGVAGEFTFDQDHTPIKGVIVQQVLDGQIIYIETVLP